MPEPRLVFTGNVIADIVMTVGALPERGGDVIASSSDIAAGGGYNTMVAALRDGLPVVFAGQYGTGPFADIVRGALSASGAEIVLPGLAEPDSGYCVVLVDPSAERTFVTHVGAEGRLTRPDLDRVDVRAGDIVYVSGYSLAHPVNASSLPGWLEDLPAGARVILDPSPLVGTLEPALLTRVLARADVLSLNAREARTAAATDDLASAAASLRGRIAPGGSVIVRNGAAGCLVTDGEGTTTAVPGHLVRAADSNGAGDAFGGVLAAALSRGDGVLGAARRANAAAALAVTRRGPATAPSSGEIDALLRDAGAR